MNYYKNKKILITGGAGFIGSHLTRRLVQYGAKVSVIVKYNSIIDSPRLVNVWDKINVIEADLRNTDSVSEMKDLSFDVVFHLAAYNHVGDSFKHVFENVNSNLLSTVNLLNNGPKIKKLVHMGTSEIYGIQNNPEDDNHFWPLCSRIHYFYPEHRMPRLKLYMCPAETAKNPRVVKSCMQTFFS